MKSKENKIFSKYNIRFVFILLFFLFNSNLLAIEDFIFVTKNSLVTKERINKLTSLLRTSGIKNVILQVNSKGTAYYKSTILPFSDEIEEKDANFSPLDYYFSKINKSDIKTHLWINGYYVWNKYTAPTDKKHIYFKDNVFVVNKYNENMKNIPLEKLKKEGLNGYFLDPTNPEVTKYLCDIVDELINLYGDKIAGIHFDYIRFPNKNYRYNLNNVKEFMNLYEFNPIKLNESEKVQLNIWDKWIAGKISSELKKISDYIKGKNKNLILSISVIPNGLVALQEYGQNWEAWIDKNIVDYCIPMTYTKNGELLNQYFMDDLYKYRKKNLIIPIPLHVQNTEEALKTFKYIKENGYDLIGIYSYDNISENPEFILKYKSSKNLISEKK